MMYWRTTEIKAQEALTKEFGMRFGKSYPIIGEYSREIDLMSDDNQAAAQVKAGRDFQANGRIKPYRFAEMCADCLTLLSIPAKRRIFFIGDPDMLEQFKRESKGFPFHEVEIRPV